MLRAVWGRKKALSPHLPFLFPPSAWLLSEGRLIVLCWAMTQLGHIIPGAAHSQLRSLLSCVTVGRGCCEGLIIGLSASGSELVIAVLSWSLPPACPLALQASHIGETHIGSWCTCNAPCRWTANRSSGDSVSEKEFWRKGKATHSVRPQSSLYYFVYTDLFPPLSNLLMSFPEGRYDFRGTPQDLVPRITDF